MGIFKNLQKEVSERDERDGISMPELIDLDPPLRSLMNRITRKEELTAEQAAKSLDVALEEVEEHLRYLLSKGYVVRESRDGVWYYRIKLARKRGSDIPLGIWSALGERAKPGEE